MSQPRPLPFPPTRRPQAVRIHYTSHRHDSSRPTTSALPSRLAARSLFPAKPASPLSVPPGDAKRTHQVIEKKQSAKNVCAGIEGVSPLQNGSLVVGQVAQRPRRGRFKTHQALSFQWHYPGTLIAVSSLRFPWSTSGKGNGPGGRHPGRHPCQAALSITKWNT